MENINRLKIPDTCIVRYYCHFYTGQRNKIPDCPDTWKPYFSAMHSIDIVVVFVILRRTLHLSINGVVPPPFHRLGTVTGVVVQSSGGGNSRPCVPWFADPCLQRKLESALLLRPGWRTHRTCSRRVAF